MATTSITVTGLLVAAMACTRPAARLSFIEDDLVRARAEASQRHLPLFVEVSADW